MSYELTLKHREPTTIVSLRGPVPFATIAQEIGKAYGTLGDAIQRHGGSICGFPMSICYSMILGGLDLECALPITEEIDVESPIICRELPAGTVVSTIHKGDYAQLAAAHLAVRRWLQDNGRPSTLPTHETYLNDPSTCSSPSEYLTEIFAYID